MPFGAPMGVVFSRSGRSRNGRHACSGQLRMANPGGAGQSMGRKLRYPGFPWRKGDFWINKERYFQDRYSMNFGIRNKVALVAAASRGLGYATAMELAREGAQVAVCGRDEQRIHRAAAELSASTGGRILPVVADVEKAQDCEYFIAQAAETLGSVDILVTNAGGPPAGFFEDIDDESWALGFERTMMSAIRLIRAALPHMREK
ncbi:MAG TPA: SDR family NAD(P)-dependent oxidoreductase, partial [Bacteroidetes bacterium]|nr:SDR family NAD(P)-dependent oxidoreductase [Bacteroidota bacterium]